MREVLGRCEALRAETGGAFDARAAGRAAGLSVDPTGLVKGWAVERAAALLEAAGARRFLIDAGGDVVVRGGAWRVGIRHPRRRRRLAAVLALDDGAVATSGAYERGPHIVDPRTGRPATGALSVTVLGPDLGTADAYATAAFAMGSRGPAWTAGLAGYEAMTIVPGDRVLATPGFLRRCPGGSAARSLETGMSTGFPDADARSNFDRERRRRRWPASSPSCARSPTTSRRCSRSRRSWARSAAAASATSACR